MDNAKVFKLATSFQTITPNLRIDDFFANLKSRTTSFSALKEHIVLINNQIVLSHAYRKAKPYGKHENGASVMENLRAAPFEDILSVVVEPPTTKKVSHHLKMQ